jgi:chaperonin cofactor prefoldin
MSELNPSINPNTADLDELTLLPGVGQALAQRIIENRPFSSLEDMRRVPGLGERTLESMLPMIDLDESGDLSTDTAAEAETEPELRAATDSPNGNRIDQGIYITRSQALGISAATAGVGVIVSILLVFSIFIGINRTLNYSRHSAIRDLMTNVGQIEVQVEEVEGTLDGFERRLDALEGLSGRMTELESETEDLAGRVEDASSRVQQMRTRVEQISLQIEELARRSDKQTTFFERLQQLLVEVFGNLVEEKVP